MTLSEVLNEIRERNGLKNQTELANFLGIDKRRIGEYYSGRQPMDDDYPRIAMAAKMRVDEIQAIVKLQSTNEESRRIWQEYYKSIGGVAAGIAVLGFVSGMTLEAPQKETASIAGSRSDDSGRACRDRTYDKRIKSPLLYQLS